MWVCRVRLGRPGAQRTQVADVQVPAELLVCDGHQIGARQLQMAHLGHQHAQLQVLEPPRHLVGGPGVHFRAAHRRGKIMAVRQYLYFFFFFCWTTE